MAVVGHLFIKWKEVTVYAVEGVLMPSLIRSVLLHLYSFQVTRLKFSPVNLPSPPPGGGVSLWNHA
jgi:hypothetical protein